jgi:hypothetical protein
VYSSLWAFSLRPLFYTSYMCTIQTTRATYTSNCKLNTILCDPPVNVRIKASKKDLEHWHHLILHYHISPNKTWHFTWNLSNEPSSPRFCWKEARSGGPSITIDINTIFTNILRISVLHISFPKHISNRLIPRWCASIFLFFFCFQYVIFQYLCIASLLSVSSIVFLSWGK